jgi:hypothetical protein
MIHKIKLVSISTQLSTFLTPKEGALLEMQKIETMGYKFAYHSSYWTIWKIIAQYKTHMIPHFNTLTVMIYPYTLECTIFFLFLTL